jgi:hypothetical protein
MGWGDLLIIAGVVLGSGALGELFNVLYVYNNDALAKLSADVERLERTLTLVKSKRARSSAASADKSLQREEERLERELMTLKPQKMGLTMRSTIVTTVLQFATFYALSSWFANVTVATLPFVPTWSYFTMIFRRGLPADAPPNACSYLFFMIVANIVLKPLVNMLMGTEAQAKALAAQSGGGLAEVFKNASAQSEKLQAAAKAR